MTLSPMIYCYSGIKYIVLKTFSHICANCGNPGMASDIMAEEKFKGHGKSQPQEADRHSLAAGNRRKEPYDTKDIDAEKKQTGES